MLSRIGSSTLNNYVRIGTAEYSAPDIADIHYFFESNSLDSSGNNWHATGSDMKYVTSPTPPQGTYCGDFSNDTTTYFRIPDNYVLGPTGSFSLSCWVYNNDTTGFPRIMAPYDDAGWQYWRWWFRADNGRIEFRGYKNSTSDLDLAYTTTDTWVNNTSTWHHMVMSYDNGEIQLGYDGELIDIIGNPIWDTDDLTLDYNPLYIGRLWNGYIDDFSIYDFILSEDQVNTLYNSGSAGTILTE